MDVILYNKIAKLENKVKGMSVIPTPANFKWADNPLEGHIFRTEEGILCDIDVADFRPTGKTYWVDPNGNDSNSGEDADHPLLKISTAMNKADAVVVVLKDGFYNHNRAPLHLNGYSKSIAVVAAEGATPVIGSIEGTQTYTKTDGYTYVYQTSYYANCVWDVVNKKPYMQLTSIADVESMAGSFYTDGTTTYVHLLDGSEPNYNKIRPCKQTDVFRITASGAITVYIEGITVCGGGYGGFRVTSDGTNRPTVYAKNCKFFGSLLNSALYLEGCFSILQNCEAGYATEDGFGYHAKTTSPRAVEINCEGHHNGLEGGTDNGSTMHDGGVIIRINGKYHHNKGPNVADVHNTTASWNLGCHAWRSAIETQDNANADFVVSSDQANMGLDNCSAYGSYYSLFANSTGVVHERGNAFVTRKVGADCAIESY